MYLSRLAILAVIAPTFAFAQVEQGPAAASFEPAFPEQTRAPALPTTDVQTEQFV